MDPRQRLADSSARMLRGCYFLGQNLEHSRALTYNRCQLCIGFSGIHPPPVLEPLATNRLWLDLPS
jgi:hypothetical protein